MGTIVKAAAGVSTIWSLAAFAIAVIAYLALKQRSGKVPSIAWGFLVGIVFLGLVPIVGSIYAGQEKEKNRDRALYELRVTVRDKEHGTLVDRVNLTSSVGVSPSQSNGSWEFKIPFKSRPADGKVTISAEVPTLALSGTTDIVLAEDYEPVTTVWLVPGPNSVVRGIVVDASGNAIEGAHVSVVGYGDEKVTQPNGHFEMLAHVADGQQVEVHVQKNGFDAVTQGHLAGNFPATIVLHRKRTR